MKFKIRRFKLSLIVNFISWDYETTGIKNQSMLSIMFNLPHTIRYEFLLVLDHRQLHSSDQEQRAHSESQQKKVALFYHQQQGLHDDS